MSRVRIVTDIITAARAEPYAYGSNDCFFLGLKVIDALQGTGHVHAFAGSYTTLLGANRTLRRRGHKSVVTLYAELVEPIAWGSARIGDVAVVDSAGVEHVAVHGGQSWLSITAEGPMSWPLEAAKQAFGV